METFIILLAICLALYILQQYNFKKKKKHFIETLPAGFGYAYFRKGTGFAVNPVQNEIILLVEGKTRTYTRSSIRQVRYVIAKPDKIIGSGLNANAHIIRAEIEASRATGIFFELADIDHPEIKIKIKGKHEIQRNFEILQQFMDGVLKPYDEYMASQAHKK